MDERTTIGDRGVDPDLEAIADDLAATEVALSRLDEGTYWTDEATGEALSDDLLAERPTARRAPGSA